MALLVGLDVGSAMTRVIVAQKNKDGMRILGVGMSESRGLHHGFITTPEVVTQSIKKALADAEAQSGQKIRKVVASVSGISLSGESTSGTVIVSRADKEVSANDITAAMVASQENLVLQNKKVLHRIVTGYKLDGKEVIGSPVGMKGMKIEVKSLFISCVEQHLDRLIEAITDAGVEVVDVVAAPLAAAELVLSERQKNAGCALVDVGSETMTVLTYENGVPLSLAVFSVGSMNITNDIALGLRITQEEAEGLKIGTVISDVPRKKLDEIIDARLTELFEIIDAHLRKIRRSGLLPAGIILIGGGAQYPQTENLVKELLRLPSRFADPDIWGDSRNRLRDASWFVAAGLCSSKEQSLLQNEDEHTSIIAQIKRFFRTITQQLLP